MNNEHTPARSMFEEYYPDGQPVTPDTDYWDSIVFKSKGLCIMDLLELTSVPMIKEAVLKADALSAKQMVLNASRAMGSSEIPIDDMSPQQLLAFQHQLLEFFKQNDWLAPEKEDPLCGVSSDQDSDISPF